MASLEHMVEEPIEKEAKKRTPLVENLADIDRAIKQIWKLESRGDITTRKAGQLLSGLDLVQDILAMLPRPVSITVDLEERQEICREVREWEKQHNFMEWNIPFVLEGGPSPHSRDRASAEGLRQATSEVFAAGYTEEIKISEMMDELRLLFKTAKLKTKKLKINEDPLDQGADLEELRFAAAELNSLPTDQREPQQ